MIFVHVCILLSLIDHLYHNVCDMIRGESYFLTLPMIIIEILGIIVSLYLIIGKARKENSGDKTGDGDVSSGD